MSGGYAGPDLFTAVGLRIVAGRGFTDADRQSRPQVAVVNETAARNLTGPAVGALVNVGPPGRPFDASLPVRVVGVVEASREPRLEAGELPAARVYLPSPLEDELALTAYVRTSGPATATAQPLRELVGAHRAAGTDPRARFARGIQRALLRHATVAGAGGWLHRRRSVFSWRPPASTA